jgi:hypothetical protein
MENSVQKSTDSQLMQFDPAVAYRGASNLRLSESERKSLTDPFDDLEYEIRPDGFIYIPQVLTLQRINRVIGVGQWSILLINSGKDEIRKDTFKVFYDGALVIRDCFVSRAVGEASYNRTNNNSSWASAFEAAKSDCRQRCCKDIGIASDAWNPTFIRRWQKEHAIKVWVNDNGQQKCVWRRKDIDPFPNETGPVLSQAAIRQQAADEKPWLNAGPDFDAAMVQLQSGSQTIQSLKNRYKISKATEESIVKGLVTYWQQKTDECSDMARLTSLYNEHAAMVEASPFIKDVFTARRLIILKSISTNGKQKVQTA